MSYETQAKGGSIVSLTQEQKHQLNKLRDYRDEISYSLYHIQRVLRDYFPEEYAQAYQHWIPQIVTALEDNPKWLNRGVHNMQDTLNKLQDRDPEAFLPSDHIKGITKVIT